MQRMKRRAQSAHRLRIGGYRDVIRAQLGKGYHQTCIESDPTAQHDLSFEAHTCRYT